MALRNRFPATPFALAAALLTALGCQAPQSPTAPATAAPAGVAAVTAPSATPVSPTPEPLATAAVDTDLSADDETSVEAAIDGIDLQDYLPSTLIHDGGVILYNLLGLAAATGSPRPGALASAIATRRDACNGLTSAPDSWSRDTDQVGKRQLRVRRVAGTPGEVSVQVTWQNSGTLVYKTPADGKVKKPFVEQDQRTLVLARDGGRWHVDSLTPISIVSKGGHAGLDISQVRVYRGDDATPVLSFDEQDPLISLSDKVPTFAKGDQLRVEVEVTDKQACSLFVFAHLVGKTNHDREPLQANASGVYTGTFTMGAGGVQNIAIDVLEPAVFTPAGAYHANGLGMNLKVK